MGTEIAQPMPTHFDFANKSCSRIDRAWAFGPSNFLIKLQVRSHVVGTPEEYYGNGLSDHAPLIVSLGPMDLVHKCEVSIPKFVCKHPNFSVHVDAYASYVDLLNLPNHVQMNVYKDCLKEASKKVLDDIKHAEGESLQSQRMISLLFPELCGSTTYPWQRSFFHLQCLLNHILISLVAELSF